MVAVENIPQVIAFKKFRVLYHIALVVLIVLLFFFVKDKSLQLVIFAALLLLYFLGIFYMVYSKPSYFRMAIINDNELQIRYFMLHFADGKKRAVQFHVSQLQAYKIQVKPLKKFNLTLIIETNNQPAQYPPISISLLSTKQRHFLASFLDKILKEVQ